MDLIFKTNLKCSGCVAAIHDTMEKDPNIINWKVDLEHEEKLLIIEAKAAKPAYFTQLGKTMGFTFEEKKSFFKKLFG